MCRENLYFLYKQLLGGCPVLLLIDFMFLKKPSNWQHHRQIKAVETMISFEQIPGQPACNTIQLLVFTPKPFQ